MARRLFLAASILVTLALPALPAGAANCEGDTTGLVALPDLGAGTYLGVQGGLYAGGTNHRPIAHNEAGIAIANTLAPLDTLGNPDPVNGRIVLVSIGMSNCTQEFSAFVPKANADPTRNPKVLVIDCAVGGQTASVIKSPTAWYWDTVATRLRGRGSSPRQVQAVWLKEANAGPSGGFPYAADILTRDLGGAVRTLEQKLPSTKLCYLTSRIYAGYATTALNPEPYAYESGFAVRKLILAQIDGVDSLEYDAAHGPVYAPWLAWGPYLWSDGLRGRADGLTWKCTDFSASDGTHPSTSGRLRVADSLLAFFRADQTTAPWYLAAPLSAPPRAPGAAFAVAPNPAHGPVELRFMVEPDVSWRLDLHDLAGRRVRELGRGVGSGGGELVRWDRRDAAGRGVRPGVYYARLTRGSATDSRLLVLLDGR